MPEVISVTEHPRTMEKTGSFDDLLLGVIDETMKQIFREAGTDVIYGFIENKCHLKRREIAEKPEVFSADLRKLLGSAAPVIERMILKSLYSKLRLKFYVNKSYKFSDYIKELKKSAVVE